jgi:hypothetical protein
VCGVVWEVDVGVVLLKVVVVCVTSSLSHCKILCFFAALSTLLVSSFSALHFRSRFFTSVRQCPTGRSANFFVQSLSGAFGSLLSPIASSALL